MLFPERSYRDFTSADSHAAQSIVRAERAKLCAEELCAEELSPADRSHDLESIACEDWRSGVAAARNDLAVLLDGDFLSGEVHADDDVGDRPRVADVGRSTV